MTETLSSTIPIKSTPTPCGWFGGKRRLAKSLSYLMHDIPHVTYAEPFLGMGGVFLRRTFKSKCEVINDLDNEIINLFRVIQRHKEYFIDYLKYFVASQSLFTQLRDQSTFNLTDIERAARFIYVQKMSFGGHGRSFGWSKKEPGSFSHKNLIKTLDLINARLDQVHLICKPYADFIDYYDSKETLFYLDPPYMGRALENCYNVKFSHDEFSKMAEQLMNIEGIFIMSINDIPEVHETFNKFNIYRVPTVYSASKAYDTRSTVKYELIISNIDIQNKIDEILKQ